MQPKLVLGENIGSRPLLLLAMLLSSLLLVNLMNALLAGQIRQIGVMKAVGARPRQLIGMYFTMVFLYGALSPDPTKDPMPAEPQPGETGQPVHPEVLQPSAKTSTRRIRPAPARSQARWSASQHIAFDCV